MADAANKKFRAMGTDCHIVVTGPNALRLADLGERRVGDLEQLWSRFLPQSEISRLNQSGRRSVPVSRPTFELVKTAISAWRLSGGLYDPTMYEQINDLGYNKTFEAVGPGTQVTSYEGVPATGCAEIVLDCDQLTVKLPKGLGIDPGGIGKGLAADMISKELMYAGAHGALVSLGGDLRVRGLAPSEAGWVVKVRNPNSVQDTLATVVLDNAALATSTTVDRTWNTDSGHQHHLLDPRTGLPASGNVVSATAIAGEGWWAEAAAKSAVLSSCEELTHIPNVATLQVFADQSQQRTGDFESYEL